MKALTIIYYVIQLVLLIVTIVLLAIREHEAFQNTLLFTLMLDMLVKGYASDRYHDNK